MGLVDRDDGWRVPDWLWEKVEPLLPPRPKHPLGCHNPRVPDRDAMDAILLVLRTWMQWNALNATGICHSSYDVIGNHVRQLRGNLPQAFVHALLLEAAVRLEGER